MRRASGCSFKQVSFRAQGCPLRFASKTRYLRAPESQFGVAISLVRLAAIAAFELLIEVDWNFHYVE